MLENSFLQQIIVFLILLKPFPQLVGQNTTFPTFKQDENIRKAKTKEILKYMKLSIDPCVDFYEYACGNWPKFHTPPDNKKEEIETANSLLESKVNKDLHKLLDESVTVDDSATAKKLKTFYKSCLETKRNAVEHQLFLNEFIKNNGGFPATPGSNWVLHHQNYDWQQKVAGLRYNYGMDILIGMEININYQSMHENSIYLCEPATIIPKHLCSYRGTQAVELTDLEYVPIETEVANNLRLWLSLNEEEAWKLAADILTFEFELCTAMHVNEADEQDFVGSINPEMFNKKYARKTLIDFTHQLENKIDFNSVVTSSFGVPVYKPVFMKSPQYFEKLIKVMDVNNSTTVANYVMYRAMSYTNLPLNDTLHSRPSYCLETVKKYFPKILGEMYHRKYAQAVHQEQVRIIFEKLKEVFSASLQQEWIESSTAKLGKNKLAEMNLYFPTYDKITINLQFSRNDYWTNLVLTMREVREHELSRLFATGLPSLKDEVEAYETRVVYRPYRKRIDIGWGLFQASYYQPDLPHSITFAVVGGKLGEAIALAFDDYGWTTDINGHNNWDPNTAVEFYKRANCLRHQIGNYLNNDPNSFRNMTKTRELIAKTSAVNIAFSAYLDWLRYQNPHNDHDVLSQETLFELNFTNTQLFFIAFAQTHCQAQRRDSTKFERLMIPPLSALENHTLTRYQVNGPLSNFKEFAREFGCALGSEMNSADKCIIY